jgi:hypothetical protein
VTTVELVEFVPGEGDHGIAEIMADLADGSGWLTLDPAFDEDFPPPQQTTFGRMVSGRGPAVPRANWVPADLDRRRPEPVSVGILHGTGPKAISRLAEKGIVVPERWKVVADHPKRGVVAWVPVDVAHREVLAWTCAAARALTRVPLEEQWRVAVHRR